MNLLIDELPSEILIKICSYLPYHSEIALVNKQFYAVVCKLNDRGIRLTLHRSLAENPKALKCFMNMTRKVTDICIEGIDETEGFPKFIIDIVKKFSATLTHLELRMIIISLESFINLISLVPEATHVVLGTIQSVPVELESLRTKLFLLESRKDINLLHLNVLKISRCSSEYLKFFNQLPTGVLVDLTLIDADLKDLKILFEKQTNIKKLSICCNESNNWSEADFFPQKLESLEWYCESFRSMGQKSILSSQKNLKYLELVDGDVDNDLMDIIANKLTELETLYICVSDESLNAFKRIRKLHNLKNVCLRSDDDTILIKHYETFAKLDNSRITTLDIRFCNFIYFEEIIDAMAKSVSNLKVLFFDCCNSNTDIVHAIMKSFNFVETLNFHFGCKNKGDYETLFQDGCFNPKLIELVGFYLFSHGTRLLKKIIEDYPNLKKLDVQSTKLFTTKQFKMILEGFSKIESLSLGYINLSKKKLSLLKKHKIKIISIKLKEIFPEEMIDKLRKIFYSVSWCSDVITLKYMTLQ